MGNPTRSRRIRLVPMACMAAITILGLAACGSADPTDKNVKELQDRGFQNVTALDTTLSKGSGVYYVGAGNCRFKVWYVPSISEEAEQKGLGQGFTLTEDSSRGEESNLRVYEPSLAKIQQLDPLKYCFEGAQPTEQPTSAEN